MMSVLRLLTSHTLKFYSVSNGRFIMHVACMANVPPPSTFKLDTVQLFKIDRVTRFLFFIFVYEFFDVVH